MVAIFCHGWFAADGWLSCLSSTGGFLFVTRSLLLLRRYHWLICCCFVGHRRLIGVVNFLLSPRQLMDASFVTVARLIVGYFVAPAAFVYYLLAVDLRLVIYCFWMFYLVLLRAVVLAVIHSPLVHC